MTLLLLTLLLQDGAAVTYGDVELANDMKRPSLQGQAFEKVFGAGRASIAAIEEFVQRKGHNGLTLQFTQRLGEIDDPKMAALLVTLYSDKDFYWRPAATEALAEMATKQHAPLFREGLKDLLWGVRQHSVIGLENLDDRGAISEIKKLLADDIFDVRAQAAKTLAEFGDETGLPVLVASMRDTTQWFAIDYGQIAREESFNFLKKYTGLDFGFRAWEPAAQREPSVQRWEAWITEKFPGWKKMVPETAQPHKDPSEYLFGFELRSCQRGDFLFRIDTAGVISLGFFNVTREKLTAEEFSKFKEAVSATQAVDPSQPPGRSGCDFEKYYVLTEQGGYRTPVVFVEGRPARMDGFINTCVGLIGSHFGEGQALEFKARARLFRELE